MRNSVALAVGVSTVLAGVIIPVTAANAAADVITVTSLGLGGNAAAGSCEATAATGDCTLRGALEIANASTNPDGVTITFAAALAGAGQISLTGGSANSMYTSDMTGSGSENATVGARFLVDSTVPVTVDFTNLDGITDVDGSHTAGIYVASDNVTLSNLTNLRAAESGIAVGGTGTSITNVGLEDPTSSTQEVGVLLLDGADDTSITDVTVFSPYWGSVVVDNNATVSNTAIDGLTSRGVENWGHVMFEDNSTVTGFTVANSVLGNPAESSPSHGIYVNPGVTIDGLAVTDTVLQSPNQNGVFFLGGGQTLTNTTFTGNTFGGNEGSNISRTIGNNSADWDGLTFSNNTVSYAGSVVFGGSLSNAQIADNSFTNISDPSFAALQLGDLTENVNVTGNSFDTVWALDTVRVQGSSATNVVIDSNDIKNLMASVSRSGVRIDAAGSGNAVQNNTLTQELDNPNLPSNADNHWAVYNSASAADAASDIGWVVQYNTIDGFGGRDRSYAPIENASTGKLPVIGNTFGVNTRGSFDPETEEGANWMLWNVYNTASNNTVQTFRPESVRFNGSTATFTATQPQNMIGNNAAIGPVTLHVYWTAADNAEEYLGALTNVTAGSRVSIDTTHTSGYIRVQTVDANGFTSQYSSIDQNVVVAPATPVVTQVTPAVVTGTGQVGSTVSIRDAAGKVVATAVVGQDGTWSIDTSKLACNTTYSVVATADGVDSDATTLVTPACTTQPGTGTGGGTGTSTGATTGTAGTLASTGMANVGGIAGGIAALVLLGGALLLVARRRQRA